MGLPLLIDQLYFRRPGSLALLTFVLTAGVACGAEHPGYVFVVGDDVRVSVPEEWVGWRAIDVDGNEVGHGTVHDGTVNLGTLPIGYFEVRQKDDRGMVSVAVLAKTVATLDTPIALDAAMSWFYADPEQIRHASRICRLAGVKWVRDRLSWPEIEIAPGTWAGDTRYERAMRIQREAGLKVLQVNHISPPWATGNPARFPEDLRHVHRFYRGLAERWKGLADAIEPWNEPDIELFGGHTGCEIASFQKAAYLGLKAGDPQLLVCQSVFAIDRAETLHEFEVNEVYPYFDRYTLHHYTPLPNYPRVYGRHRAVSGGRPMWTTELNLPVHWADYQTKEPSEEDQRVQAYRVAKVIATALHEGAEKAFYFILGDYVERNIQYGLLRKDLTPRPAYVAFAAVGRLLNGAEPIGRVDLGDDKLKAYLFRTVVDGIERETLVAWSETKRTGVEIRPAESAYDYLGRELSHKGKVELTRSTVFMVLPRGGSEQLQVESSPPKAGWSTGNPCPVVLQLIGSGDVKQSAFQLDETNELQLVAYNFGEQQAEGTMSIEGAVGAPNEINLAPGRREGWTVRADASGNVTVRVDVPRLGHTIVSGRVTKRDGNDE